jgi:hypothetical protein
MEASAERLNGGNFFLRVLKIPENGKAIVYLPDE